ncbi:MAG: dihydroorotate dehydrogenase electron transfer subunit [Oscillospiraceae bacterium]|nr:dihydroorotate dehydrogenase electron transfer subunit [Oscillospiraceae bacterium]
MKQVTFEIVSNRPIARDIYDLRLSGDASAITAPGQFVNLRLPGFYLRRPISVCDWGKDWLRLVYKVQGKGTAALSAYPAGAALDALTGLGNGYDLPRCGARPLLVGGGVGVPPLLGLAKCLTDQGKSPCAVLGFNTAAEAILTEDFAALAVPVTLCTVDGSAGLRGLVTDGMDRVEDYSHVCACGPEAMLRAVSAKCATGGQFSLEERMGCGFGACMGCSCQTKSGPKRICREGPVLNKEELLW